MADVRRIKSAGSPQGGAPDYAKLSEEMYAIFSGHPEEWGKYPRPTGAKGDSGKQVADIDSIKTIRSAWGVGEWSSHLRGEFGLGVVPIRGDNTCLWGALDIDVYKGFDVPAFARRVAELKLPFTVGRTKSGGAHAWVFFQQPVSAKDLKQKLHEIAAGLGHGKCEVFPKQSRVIVDRGEMGCWLNMPYFDLTSPTRFAFDNTGRALAIQDFILRAKTSRTTWDAFQKLTLPTDEGLLPGGPPCLQYIAKQGVPDGMRNVVLFNVGVYARARWPEREAVQKFVEKFNNEVCDPPLAASELMNLTNSNNKKEYRYQCQQVPLCSFCNAPVCRTREYGVKTGPGMVTMDALSMLATDPPIWFLDVEGERMECTTEDIQNQIRFQRRCMEQLQIMPPRYAEKDWQQVIQNLMENVTVIPAPQEATVKGEFYILLEEFCTQQSVGGNLDLIFQGKPFKDDDEERIYFRLHDLLGYIQRRGFKDYRAAHVAARLREVDGHARVSKNIKGKFVNLWSLPAFKEVGPLEVPDMKERRPY